MSKILYYLILYPISKLPLWLQHKFSNLAFFIIYRVFGYRKAVVEHNIKNSFPDKSDQWVTEKMSLFYRHLTDIITESISYFTISETEILKRCEVVNPEVLNDLYDKGRSVILTSGHYNSWEVGGTVLKHYCKHNICGLYSPLNDKFFDNKMKEARSRLGMEMITKNSFKELAKNENEKTAYLFANDQSPTNPDRAHWMTFLNQDTAVLFGIEKYAKDYNLAIVQGYIEKVKRSHYKLTMELVFENPKETSHGEITETLTKILEKQIIDKPEFWLWSHKRWKLKRNKSANNADN